MCYQCLWRVYSEGDGVMSDQYLGDIQSLCPYFANSKINWAKIQNSRLWSYISGLSKVEQNPAFHGEGDVLTHTKMVCERLVSLQAWKDLNKINRDELFIAALLHDIGKMRTTTFCFATGTIISTHHAKVGAKMVRSMLWRDFNISGTSERANFRETVCALIAHRSVPCKLIELGDTSLINLEIANLASIQDTFSDFNLHMLSILAQADTLGRIAYDVDNMLLNIESFRTAAAGIDCLYSFKTFSTALERYLYLRGKNVGTAPYIAKKTWGKIIVLCGLPGTGKDTYIETQLLKGRELPVISSDVVRAELRASPLGDQSYVFEEVENRLRVLLRNRQEFIWNSTNLVKKHRLKFNKLFISCNASVECIFLETGWIENMRRNSSRDKSKFVPEDKIALKLSKLDVPTCAESNELVWKCI